MLKRSIIEIHLPINIHTSDVEGEIPAFGLVIVGKRSQSRRFPVKHGLLVVRRSADDCSTQVVVQQGGASDLHISTHVISEGQGGEGVHTLLVVQIRTAGDGILRGVGRGAVARGNGVVLIVIVAHHAGHGGQIDHLGVVAAEDLSTGAQLPGHGLRLPLLDLGGIAALVVNVLEVGDVVGGPVSGVAEVPGHVARVAASGDLLEDPEGAVFHALALVELVVVEHHPLVVVEAAVVEGVVVHPLFGGGGQTVGQSAASPLEHGLRLDVLVQGLVPDGDGGLHDSQACGGDVEVVTGGESAGVSGHGNLVAGNELLVAGSGSSDMIAAMKAEVIRLVNTVHSLSSSPGHVGKEDILVVGKNFDKGRAAVDSITLVVVDTVVEGSVGIVLTIALATTLLGKDTG